MHITKITNPTEKQTITRTILEALPDWFGIPYPLGRMEPMPGICNGTVAFSSIYNSPITTNGDLYDT